MKIDVTEVLYHYEGPTILIVWREELEITGGTPTVSTGTPYTALYGEKPPYLTTEDLEYDGFYKIPEQNMPNTSFYWEGIVADYFPETQFVTNKRKIIIHNYKRKLYGCLRYLDLTGEPINLDLKDVYTDGEVGEVSTDMTIKEYAITRDNYKFVGWSFTKYDVGKGTAEYLPNNTYIFLCVEDLFSGLILYPVYKKYCDVYVKLGGEWKEGTFYIKHSNTYTNKCTIFVKENGLWKE